MLFQTTTHNRTSIILRPRKHLKKSLSKTKIARKIFGDKPQKNLNIPVFVDKYNYYINNVNKGDQLKSYNPNKKLIRRGRHQVLIYYFLNVILVNSYLISKYSQIPRKKQIDFYS
jgi:hypothetical protein